MRTQRIFGIAMVIVGVAVLISGIIANHSVADALGNTLTARPAWNNACIFGGNTMAVAGLLMIVFGGRGTGRAHHHINK